MMGCKLLIVDDSKLARMAVVRILRALHPDWTSIEAGDADQALARLREDSVDFVLLDFNMPGKDGVTVAEEMRAINSKLKIAVISANTQLEVLARAQAAGAAFLRKPLTESALQDFIIGSPSAGHAIA